MLQVTFDAADPSAQADFWALALGYRPQPPPEGYDSWQQVADEIGIPADQRGDLAAVVPPEDEVGPRLLFLRVEEPKTAKNKVHLDVHPVGAHVPEDGDGDERRAAHVARLVEAGATHVRSHDEPMGTWDVLTDPEGNEFCVH